MSVQRFPRGASVATRWPMLLVYGSHRDGWTHRTIAAGTVLTVVGSSRWSVRVASADGGTATVARSSIALLGGS